MLKLLIMSRSNDSMRIFLCIQIIIVKIHFDILWKDLFLIKQYQIASRHG